MDDHQAVQHKITELQKEIDKRDQVIAQFAQQVRELEKSLQDSIINAKSHLEYLNYASNQLLKCSSPILILLREFVDVTELVNYAQRIAYTTTAPPKPWVPGNPLYK